MARFPTANNTNTQDIFEMFKFINNDATGGLFFPVMLLVIWVVSFGGSLASGNLASRSWVFASFFCSVLSILMVLMGFLDKGYMFFLVLMLAAGILWVKLTGRNANV